MLEHRNPIDAIRAAVEHNHGWYRWIWDATLRSLPVVGILNSLVVPSWRVLRELCLIAGCFGHDLDDEDIQKAIMNFYYNRHVSEEPISAAFATTIAAVATPIVHEELIQQKAIEICTDDIRNFLLYYLPWAKGFNFLHNCAAICAKTSIKSLTDPTPEMAKLQKHLNFKLSDAVFERDPSAPLEIALETTLISTAAAATIGIPLNLLLRYLCDDSQKIFASALSYFKKRAEEGKGNAVPSGRFVDVGLEGSLFLLVDAE